MKIEFLVADDEEREMLAELGHRLFNETVTYKRNENTWQWKMLSQWSYDALKPAPWLFSFEFSSEALRALQMLGDSRLESVKFLADRAQKAATIH